MRRGGLHTFVRLAWPIVEPAATFVDGWHLAAVCELCESIGRGERRDTVLNLPPGTTKSGVTGIFWPAWDWIENPWRRFMHASFDSSLLNGHSTKLITLLQSSWYVERWGAKLPVGKPNTSEIRVRGGGMKFNTSFGGRGTGRHCHIQVLDDPIKPRDAAGGAAITGVMLDATWETINNTFASRAADPKSFARLMVMQRIHEDDPSARALKQGWSHVCFPMQFEPERADPLDRRTVAGELISPRFTADFVAKLQRDETTWATQYQQRPAAPGGAIIRGEWIDGASCSLAEAWAKVGRSVQSWDLAFKDSEASDHVAGQYWRLTFEHDEQGKPLPHLWLLARSANVASFVQTCGDILARARTWPTPEVLIEDKANGPAAESQLRSRMPVGTLQLVTPKGSKTSRVHACAMFFSGAQVHIPRDLPDGPDDPEIVHDAARPWHGSRGYEAIRSALTKFPRVRRDDEVDACTQAILRLTENWEAVAALQAIDMAALGRFR